MNVVPTASAEITSIFPPWAVTSSFAIHAASDAGMGWATAGSENFRLYLQGKSLQTIAYALNTDQVPPARRGRYRRKGWVASTIRDMLYNGAYVGDWKFKKRQWQKVPGTNARRYRDRPANEVIQRTYPERRIIDDETWTAVQARLADVRA